MREVIRADEADDLCVEMALHTRADAHYDARIAGRWSSGVIMGHQGSSAGVMVTRAFGSKAFVRPSLVIARMLRYASNCVQNRFM
jgi:hypothetical protein